jgi:hypothetical protein
MAESVMSDARHTFLMFTPDFCNPARLSRKSGVSSGGFKTIWGWASALSRVIASSRF